MFEVTTTGKNKCYGLKGEKHIIADGFLTVALKEGWIEDEIEYVGHGTKQIQATAKGVLGAKFPEFLVLCDVVRKLEKRIRTIEKVLR
jgi:hypothetical protein